MLCNPLAPSNNYQDIERIRSIPYVPPCCCIPGNLSWITSQQLAPSASTFPPPCGKGQSYVVALVAGIQELSDKNAVVQTTARTAFETLWLIDSEITTSPICDAPVFSAILLSHLPLTYLSRPLPDLDALSRTARGSQKPGNRTSSTLKRSSYFTRQRLLQYRYCCSSPTPVLLDFGLSESEPELGAP